MLHQVEEDEGFLKSVIFSDECTFYVSGKVNAHSCRIWGSESHHECMEHVRGSPKLYVFCAMSINKVYGLFFFMKRNITSIVYLDLLQNFLIPQLDQDYLEESTFFHQGGPSSHFHREVRWVGGV
jgi:hypothetical protein